MVIQRPVFWIVLFLIIVIGAGVYFIFFFPQFQISHVQVFGNETIAKEGIEDTFWSEVTGIFGIPSKSIFVIDTQRVAQSLIKESPIIEGVSVQKNFPNGVDIMLKERRAIAVFCDTNNHCFSIDNHGVVFEELQSVPENSTVLRGEKISNTIFTGEEVIPASTIDMILKIENNLKNTFQIDIQEALASNPLVITTSEGWKIYFDPDASIDLQIIKMNTLLENEIIEQKRKNLQYIYLQYKDRAYYK